jgi:predicted ABC-type ATPase
VIVTTIDTRSIILAGPGGAGKTTVGALVSERLGAAFVDLDHPIEPDIFPRVTVVAEPRDIRADVSDAGAKAFARSAAREEAVIRERFPVYVALSARKIETMGTLPVIVDEVVASLKSMPKDPLIGG